MINYLLHLLTFKKHSTIVCMTFCNLNLWRWAFVENGTCNQVNLIKFKVSVKFDNRVTSDFTCCLGVRQRECLSPILFAIYLNDI